MVRYHVFQGQVAVFFPRPKREKLLASGTSLASASVAKSSQQQPKGTWIPAKSQGVLNLTCSEHGDDTVIVHMALSSVGANAPDFELDICRQNCGFKLGIIAAAAGAQQVAVLLLSINSGAAPSAMVSPLYQEQVVAFKFSSILDASAFRDIINEQYSRLQQIRHSAQACQRMGSEITVTEEPASVVRNEDANACTKGHTHDLPGVQLGTLQAQTQSTRLPASKHHVLLKTYIEDPAFMEYVDELEQAWVQLEALASGQST